MNRGDGLRWTSIFCPTELAFRRELFLGGPEPRPATANREQRPFLLARTAVGQKILVQRSPRWGGWGDERGSRVSCYVFLGYTRVMKSGMTFPMYLWSMGGTTLLAWVGWLTVLFRLDPGETGIMGLVLFYITLFAALVGSIAVGGVLYRVLFLKRQQIVMREVRISFRHGIMLAFVAVATLALSAQNLLIWWNVLGLFAVLGVIEYVFVSMEESRRM